MNFDAVQRIEFELLDGTLVELDMTQALLDSIRSTFSLESDQAVTERHVKHFLVSAIKNAVNLTGDGDVEIPS